MKNLNFLFLFFFILKHTLIKNIQKAFQPLKLICEHYQYRKKFKKPGVRQVHGERVLNEMKTKKNYVKKG